MQIFTIENPGSEPLESKSNGGMFKIKKAGGALTAADGGGDDGSIVWEVVEASHNNSIPPEVLAWQPGRENAVALGASIAARLMAAAASGATAKPKKVRIEARASGAA